MVYISKVYTRFGDEGQTMLASGTTVSKASARVCAYGEVDELNAVVGVLRGQLSQPGHPGNDASGRAWSEANFPSELDAQLARIQQELFNLGAELSTPGASAEAKNLVVEARHIEALEREIDAHNEGLEPLRSFILPGGGCVGASAHLARTVCRRAERACVLLVAAAEAGEEVAIRNEPRIYLNRLSDYFFVVSRAAAKAAGVDEVLWAPEST